MTEKKYKKINPPFSHLGTEEERERREKASKNAAKSGALLRQRRFYSSGKLIQKAQANVEGPTTQAMVDRSFKKGFIKGVDEEE